MRRPIFVLIVMFLLTGGAFAQIRTLREMVLETNGPVNSVTSGNQPPMSLTELVQRSDLVVRGKVADTVSYFSPDDREIYTDLTLANVSFIYPPEAARTSKPGAAPPVIVTQLGGTLTVHGQLVRRTHRNLLPIPIGTEALFLLIEENGKLFIAAKYLGVFAIENSRLTPLTRTDWFVAEHRGKPVDAFTAEVVSLASAPR
jgi:hypothetical protein